METLFSQGQHDDPRTRFEPGDRGGARGPSTAKEGTRTIDVGYTGLTADQVKTWQDIFLPYENYASNDEIANRAINYVRELKIRYWYHTYAIRKKWRVLNWLLKGHSLNRFDDPYAVHVPELYNAMETVLPRLVSAIFDDPQWFDPEGRDEGDRRRAHKIRAHLTYQLDKMDWDTLAPQILRCMRTYGFCAFKTWWETDVDKRVKMNPEKVTTEDGHRYRFNIKEEEEVVYLGPKGQLVDPYGFLVDTRNPDAQKGAFIGDQTQWFYDDVAAVGELGIWENWKETLEQQPTSNDQWDEYLKQARSLTDEHYLGSGQRGIEGAPHEVYITEVWGKFDLFGTGRTRECVITIANDRTVLQVRENPHIDKHRPYAIGRTYTDPWEFHGVGPMDYGIPLQMELDEYRNLGLEGGKLSICPLVFVSDDSTLPDSLWGIRPGTILRVDSDNPPVFGQVKSVIKEMASMEAVLKDDLRATTKAPDVLRGTERDPTATGSMSRVMEANKQLEGEVLAFTKLAEQLLGHMHTMNRMYLPQGQTYKVLGRFAEGLTEYSWVGPEDLDWEIDFRFKAIANLKVSGTRANNLKEFLQVAATFIQANPNAVNIPGILIELWDEYVGRRPGKELILERTDPRELMSQDNEILVMLGGNPVEVHPEDDHDEHFDRIVDFMQEEDYESQPEHIKQLIHDHGQAHLTALSSQQAQQSASQNEMPGFGVAPEMGYPGQGSLPATREGGRGDGGAPLPGQTPGETPGPSNLQRMTAPMRNPSQPQDQNMPRGA